MIAITFISRVRRRVCAVVLGFALSAIVIQDGHGQIPPAQVQPSYSLAAAQAATTQGMPGLGPTGLTTLPGQNGAQQAMAQSINNVCPTISQSSVFVTPAQQNLSLRYAKR